MGAMVALASFPLNLLARATEAFKAESIDGVMQHLFGDLPVEESDAIKLKIPDIAENGAVVPVSVSTTIAGVTAIHIIIDANPNPLSASFRLTAASPADISTRVKMGKSSVVRALVKTESKVYTTSQEVKVTIGGCGG